ncbi:mechanosensitive ion channel family protein [Spirobacillus cienkowskii]|jgi:small conductance mechanosensitive channel|uniref:Mechanosensitive ion channel family protein n=1 Tax=Spirobacillus cienkowskii TaxID=495820 RepID=A0A369KXC1_9BACT|nr:MAG: mechanosensitive ion channel family protein [Spirobacillus cienkowskii]
MTINDIHLEHLGRLSYNVFLSLIVSVLMYFLAYWIIRGVRKSNTKVRKIDPTLLPITVTIIKYAAFIISVLIILNIFGANTNGIIAFLGTAGLGIALALKDTLQNIASGIMLIFLRPFKVNDYIECGSNSGTVQEINLFTTTLKTGDGLFLFVPNNLLWNSAIKNYTRNGTRRLDFVIGIAYKNQVEDARSILNKLADLDGRILKDPSPIIVVNSLTDNSVNLMLRCWIPVDNYWDVNFYLQKTVKEQFHDAGISIPFPQRDIHLHIVNEKNSNANDINTIKALM